MTSFRLMCNNSCFFVKNDEKRHLLLSVRDFISWALKTHSNQMIFNIFTHTHTKETGLKMKGGISFSHVNTLNMFMVRKVEKHRNCSVLFLRPPSSTDRWSNRDLCIMTPPPCMRVGFRPYIPLMEEHTIPSFQVLLKHESAIPNWSKTWDKDALGGPGPEVTGIWGADVQTNHSHVVT